MKWLIFSLVGLVYSLTLYVVPHSHCDAGWLQSFDDYYNSKVQHIITNSVKIMDLNPSYKFVWAETSFLKKWMEEQSNKTREKMKELIRSGNIEIVGGGYAQNDEALPDFEAVIRNIETGHKYLKETFGISQVKVAWQIDPFGHSALTPSIFSKFGYEYMVGSRIDSKFKVTCK